MYILRAELTKRSVTNATDTEEKRTTKMNKNWRTMGRGIFKEARTFEKLCILFCIRGTCSETIDNL